MHIEPLQKWVEGYKKPLLIAGPCSVESVNQFTDTVTGFAGLPVDFVRGGIWKPRTRPGSFEGHGASGLDWVDQVGEEHPLEFATEVATAEHVREALAHGVKLMWIGARTTVNPFNVQQIADAVKGRDVAVFIKNPINPDLALWKGAIERFSKAGITKLGAIHRGFHSFQTTKYRNVPFWQIPLELKSELPELPLICDPSHIAGDSELIQEVAQRALDLDYDGLMIESHCAPEKALSDAKQQVTPEHLKEILNALQLRSSSFSNEQIKDELSSIRQQIDQVDREILEAIATRMNLVSRIGDYKKENNVAIFQISRWKEIFKSRPKWGEAMNLDPEFTMELYRQIHQQSVKAQTSIFNQEDEEIL
ncbi:MAG: bifunctional 3-deoxy-7-phosphoheptulonate synthase/chorismate mutase type II [Roseivirga sp.]|nr:bifunctional 3-deoxy-7-phosphoheptulonate synthase/chorismate mutase type II [Roseivirga sp.]